MALPTFPASGSTSWYDWAKSIDARALRGAVHLDSFQNTSGSLTDEQLLDDAISYMQAATYSPTLVLGNRLHTFTTTRTPFDGLRIVGETPGPKNPEISSDLGGTTVRINVGTGTSSWWNGASGTYYDVYFGDLTVASTNAVSQFWDQPGGTLYACQFHNLTFYGLQHVMGRPAAKALHTQVSFTGHWTTMAAQDVSYTMGGADNNYWLDNRHNLQANSSVAGADRYQCVFDAMDKTNVGAGLYCTAENNWRGVKVIGSGTSRMISFWGCMIEGRNASTPCLGTLLRIESHSVNLHGVQFRFAMSSPDAGENGVVEVTGGDVSMWGNGYERATGVAETVPLVYCSAGTVDVRAQHRMGTWAGLPRADQAGGTITADATVTLI